MGISSNSEFWEMDVIFFFYFDELITYILNFLWHVLYITGNLNFE